MTASKQEQLPSPEDYKPQMHDSELESLISHNQPWMDQEEIWRTVRHEQLQQRLLNGGGS